jgi:glucose-1-phosphate thymidylyltransferase
MLEASNFVQTVQKHQGFVIGNPHEISYMKKWVTNLDSIIALCNKTTYGQYLTQLVTK